MTDTETGTEEQTTAVKGTDLEERLVAEGEIAGDYLEELLDLLDFDGDIDLDVEGDRAVVSIDGGADLSGSRLAPSGSLPHSSVGRRGGGDHVTRSRPDPAHSPAIIRTGRRGG